MTGRPHGHLDEGRWLQYLLPGKPEPQWDIVFEIDRQRITPFRIDALAAIALVGVCSSRGPAE